MRILLGMFLGIIVAGLASFFGGVDFYFRPTHDTYEQKLRVAVFREDDEAVRISSKAIDALSRDGVALCTERIPGQTPADTRFSSRNRVEFPYRFNEVDYQCRPTKNQEKGGDYFDRLARFENEIEASYRSAVVQSADAVRARCL